MKTVMVINMGMKSIRCIIFDSEGRKLSSAARNLTTAINDTRVEQNPQEWWDKAIESIKQAYTDSGLKRIDYITVTTSASCLVCVDKDGNPIGNSLMVSDKRAVKEAEEIKNNPEFSPVFKETGLDMSVSLMLPKILWIKRNEPEIFEKSRYFLTPNDFIIMKLCEAVVTDYLNAVKYHYSIDTKKYPETLLASIGIPVDSLPVVVDTGESAGKITARAAEEAGINKDAEVIVTSYDAICSFVGSGVTEEGEASDVSGTVTVLRVLCKKDDIKPSKKVYTTPFYQGDYDIIGGSNNLGGGLIEWSKQCFYSKEEYPYEVMENEAEKAEIGTNGLIFLPYLLGDRAPHFNDNARGVFFGIERMHMRKDISRAILESTGYIDMSLVDAINETNAEVHTVRLSGGLARMGLVSRIKADVLGRDVLVLSEFETTASGAAMMVLVGQGDLADFKAASERFVAVRLIIKPDKENHKKYSYMYQLFKETYDTCEPLFDSRMLLLDKIRMTRETQIENL